MSARTSTASPTVRLIGKRPPSISGRTCSTTTRRTTAVGWPSLGPARNSGALSGPADGLARGLARAPGGDTGCGPSTDISPFGRSNGFRWNRRFGRLAGRACGGSGRSPALAQRRRHPEDHERTALERISHSALVRPFGHFRIGRLDEPQPLVLILVETRQRER